jgi:pyrimidine-specific ribonucleoside hydrolase
MYGLDVFGAVRVGLAAARELAARADPAARLAGELIDFQCRRFGTQDATIGDAGAVCAVADPGGLRTRRLPVRVELAGTWTRGQTVVDQRIEGLDLAHDPHGIASTLVDVAVGVDAPRFADLWLDAVRGIG